MARQILAEKKKRTLKIIALLKKEYSSAKTSLSHKNPLEMLVATILSAQCTDKQVNIVTKKLFRKYETTGDYASANTKEFEQDIKSSGFYKNKAKSIIGTAKVLLQEYNGKVPNSMEQLTRLPGVGRKTANVVLSSVFGKNVGIVVDTHVTRITNLLGFVKTRNAEKIEQELIKLVPKKDWRFFSNALIFHGRAVCIANRPRCSECVLKKLCPSAP